MADIKFQIDTGRILSIIADEIYDSPLAMLRENTQNAYDAIRERFASDGKLRSGGAIYIYLNGSSISISDNGIGMTEEVLRENFWNAGSSGKRSDSARKAGVVGTFGIGAMANFGVCTELSVQTRALDSAQVLESVARLESLTVGEECISFHEVDAQREVGTTIKVTLQSGVTITEEEVRDYLSYYVGMLPVPVYVNDSNVSGNSLHDLPTTQGRTFEKVSEKTLSDGVVSAVFAVSVDANAQVLISVSDISFSDNPVDGSMVLLQNGGQLMGLRSFFGLAPIPSSGFFQFGGVANLAFLNPTAGREALDRDSIKQVNGLVNLAEQAASEALAEANLSDKNVALLRWIRSNQRYDLASGVTITEYPDNITVSLGSLELNNNDINYYYYSGPDHDVINTFSNAKSRVLHLSPNNPRRQVQSHYLSNILNISQVPDSAQVIKLYDAVDLSYAEAAVMLRVASTLRDDYLIPDLDLKFADISHNVSVLAEKNGDQLQIFISRGGDEIPALLGFYENAYSMFPQFIKDYVRVKIYPSIQKYVPTSTKGGVDALRKLLLKSRELYSYEESEQGEVEGILGDYLSGQESFVNVLNVARSKTRPQTQRVSAEQVGKIENELPGIVDSPVLAVPSSGERQEIEQNYNPCPPIIRDSVASDMKILTAADYYPLLNNITVFLGVSDKLMKSEAEFFHRPHTTRIIWGGHRVVYIFTEETGTLSLYYDIELKGQMKQAKTGGGEFPTTTLVTKRRIFIPIPETLAEDFQVESKPKEFFVRFDILSAEMD